MRIFIARATDGCELLQPVNQTNWAVLTDRVSGRADMAGWTPIEVALHTVDEKGRALRPADAPWLSVSALAFKQAAVDALRPELESCGDFLPLSCDASAVYVYNAKVLPGALDENASKIARLPGGTPWRIERHVFRTDVVRGCHAFKIDTLRASAVFFDEVVVDAWRAARLRGLEFDEVFSGGG